MPEVGTVWTFDYTGKEQEFITPCSGNYKVELWGAQGGSISGVAYNSDGSIRNNNLTYIGGKGAYTAGLINLNKNKILYVYVGGSPLQINTTLVSDGNHVGDLMVVSQLHLDKKFMELLVVEQPILDYPMVIGMNFLL